MAKPPTRAIELWLEFLRISDRSKWTKKVEEDFGNVWAPDFDPLEKERWFRLFIDLGDRPVKLISESIPEDIKENEDRYAIFAFDLTRPKAELLRAIRRSLDLQMSARDKKWSYGRPKHRTLKDKYSLCKRPNIPALERTLQVYKLSMEKPPLKLYEIGEKLRLNENQMPKAGDTAKTRSEKRRVLTATTARFLRHAKEIIENVQKGVFPEHGK